MGYLHFLQEPHDKLTQKGGGQTFTELISQMVDENMFTICDSWVTRLIRPNIKSLEISLSA